MGKSWVVGSNLSESRRFCFTMVDVVDLMCLFVCLFAWLFMWRRVSRFKT